LRGWTSFAQDDDRVFCNPRTGHVFDSAVHGRIFKQGLVKAGIADRVRPFHDQRHTSLTNAAVAGASGTAVQARAGHSSYATTQKYVHLAGQLFREESERAARRLWGEPVEEPVAE
jgi:site-specific recombinase XerD